MEVEAGLGGRQTRTITLANIAAPTSPALAEASRQSLEALAGATVRVEHHGLFGSEAEEPEATADAPEARGPIVAEVFGESGANLGIEQARAGMATVADGGSKELKSAEAEAHAAKRGIWAGNE